MVLLRLGSYFRSRNTREPWAKRPVGFPGIPGVFPDPACNLNYEKGFSYDPPSIFAVFWVRAPIVGNRPRRRSLNMEDITVGPQSGDLFLFPDCAPHTLDAYKAFSTGLGFGARKRHRNEAIDFVGAINIICCCSVPCMAWVAGQEDLGSWILRRI